MKRIVASAVFALFACFFPWMFAAFMYPTMKAHEPVGQHQGEAAALVGFILSGSLLIAACAAVVVSIGMYVHRRQP